MILLICLLFYLLRLDFYFMMLMLMLAKDDMPAGRRAVRAQMQYSSAIYECAEKQKVRAKMVRKMTRYRNARRLQEEGAICAAMHAMARTRRVRDRRKEVRDVKRKTRVCEQVLR